MVSLPGVDIAKTNANAISNLLVGFEACISLTHRDLDVGSAFNRVIDSVELRENNISSEGSQFTLESRDTGFNNLFSIEIPMTVRSRILSSRAIIVCHIGIQNRDLATIVTGDSRFRPIRF
jgi:elongation factor P--beta-lysine ligase